jgi:hypothetical protein
LPPSSLPHSSSVYTRRPDNARRTPRAADCCISCAATTDGSPSSSTRPLVNTSRILRGSLMKQGYDVVVAGAGNAAFCVGVKAEIDQDLAQKAWRPLESVLDWIRGFCTLSVYKAREGAFGGDVRADAPGGELCDDLHDCRGGSLTSRKCRATWGAFPGISSRCSTSICRSFATALVGRPIGACP